MRKSRFVFLIVYVVLAGLGTLFSTHLFDEHHFMRDFCVYYTNLSNYFCLAVVIVALGREERAQKRKLAAIMFGARYGQLKCVGEHDILVKARRVAGGTKCRPFVNSNPRWLQILMVIASSLILITFCVYNILLADFSFDGYWTDAYNLLFHVVLPLMFIGYTVAVCRPARLWVYLVPSLVQYLYVLIVYVRSLLLKDVAGRIVYPYFFVNFSTLGWGTSIKWLLIMLVCSLAASFIIWLLQFVVVKLCGWRKCGTAVRK